MPFHWSSKELEEMVAKLNQEKEELVCRNDFDGAADVRVVVEKLREVIFILSGDKEKPKVEVSFDTGEIEGN